MALAARLFIVEGRVQGVFFRDSTRRFAEPLGICGHAINLSNGNVEVRACGEADCVAKLRDWLKEGPPMATVVSVSEETITPFESDGFRTG